MARNSTYNILMYSHDTYGLGHIRRSMAIASHLLGPRVNILILTGSPIAGRFSFPEQIDFVRIPGMIKRTNEEYLPLSIKINARHALDIRKNIITATVKTFQPQLFIVDKEPLGLKREVLPALQWLRRNRPGTRTILGLRDIMDDAPTTRQEWRDKGVYQILEELYSEIWVYGNRELYDPIREYGISDAVSSKIHFTGYIPRKVPSPEGVQNVRKEHGLQEGEKLVVVTTGGGGDGFSVMDTYLKMLESAPAPVAFQKHPDHRALHAQVGAQEPQQARQEAGRAALPFLPPDGKDFRGGRRRGQHGRLQHPLRDPHPAYGQPGHPARNAAQGADDPRPDLQTPEPDRLHPLGRSHAGAAAAEAAGSDSRTANLPRGRRAVPPHGH